MLKRFFYLSIEILQRMVYNTKKGLRSICDDHN